MKLVKHAKNNEIAGCIILKCPYCKFQLNNYTLNYPKLISHVRCQHLKFVFPPTNKPRKVVYICSPLKDNPQDNIKLAINRGIKAYEKGYIPLIPHTIIPPITPNLSDENQEEREELIQIRKELILLCDELWYYSDKITERMKQEIEFAETWKIPTKDVKRC